MEDPDLTLALVAYVTFIPPLVYAPVAAIWRKVTFRRRAARMFDGAFPVDSPRSGTKG